MRIVLGYAVLFCARGCLVVFVAVSIFSSLTLSWLVVESWEIKRDIATMVEMAKINLNHFVNGPFLTIQRQVR